MAVGFPIALLRKGVSGAHHPRGRDALQHAVEIAGNNNMEVIYGDTDSIMVASGSDDS